MRVTGGAAIVVAAMMAVPTAVSGQGAGVAIGIEATIPSAVDLFPGDCSGSYPFGVVLRASKPVRFVHFSASVRPHVWAVGSRCFTNFRVLGTSTFRDVDYLLSRPFTAVDARAEVPFRALPDGRLSLGAGAFARSGRDMRFVVAGMSSESHVGSAMVRLGIDVYVVRPRVDLIEVTSDSAGTTMRLLGSAHPWTRLWSVHVSVGRP